MNCNDRRIGPAAFLALLILSPVRGQDYFWPTEAGRQVTATFGDMRPRRYHAGLDISTGGANGHAVNAIEDGYIERIRVATSGYGKAIHLRLKDGRVALYAHLQRFAPDMDDLVLGRQQQRQRYAVDLRFKPTDFPVLRGDIIGFTGDTGTISGPHLHFEIRDEANRPLNPLAIGLEMEDEGLPLFKSLAVIPLAATARAHGSPLPSVLIPRMVRPGWYVLDDTIAVSGPVGLAVQAYDQVPGMRYYHTLYGLSLSVDGLRHYGVQFDRFQFREGPLMELERDYRFWRLEEDDYHRLSTTVHNEDLSFILPGSGGALNLEPGYHPFAVKIWDQEQNIAVLRGVLANTPPTEVTASVEWSDDEQGWVVSLESSARLRAYHVFFFTARGKVAGSFSHRLKPGQAGTTRFVVPESRGRQRILQIIAIDHWGARLEPLHLSLIPSGEIHDRRQFELLLEPGYGSLVIQIKSDLYLPEAPEIILITSSGARRYHTTMVSPTAFLAPPIPLAHLDGLSEVRVRVDLQPPYEVRLPVRGVVVPPDDRRQLSDSADLLRVEFRPGTFYDSTFVWFSVVDVEPPDSAEFVLRPVQIGPLTVPLRGPMGLQMKVPSNRLLPDHAGLFYLDRKEGWTFMEPAGLASRENLVRTRAYRALATSGEIFALIEEHEPPEVSILRPGRGATYAAQDLNDIRIFVDDRISGIANENAIRITLDGRPLIFEYNTLRKVAHYNLLGRLSPGEHQVIVSAIDQVGNTARDTLDFNIR